MKAIHFGQLAPIPEKSTFAKQAHQLGDPSLAVALGGGLGGVALAALPSQHDGNDLDFFKVLPQEDRFEKSATPTQPKTPPKNPAASEASLHQNQTEKYKNNEIENNKTEQQDGHYLGTYYPDSKKLDEDEFSELVTSDLKSRIENEQAYIENQSEVDQKYASNLNHMNNTWQAHKPLSDREHVNAIIENYKKAYAEDIKQGIPEKLESFYSEHPTNTHNFGKNF